MNKPEIFQELTANLSSGCVLKQNEPLAKKTTLRVGGPADFYVEPATEADLVFLLQFAARTKLPFFVLGRGSNLLIRDGGVRGIVICLSQPHFSRIEAQGSQIRCGAGAKLKNIAQEARRLSLAGLEFLDGIPGSLGGALRMNAGAMGSAIFERVERVRFISHEGIIEERPVSEIPFQYRSCPLFKTHIAVEAILVGKPDSQKDVAERMNVFNQKRWEHQPKEPSAGCTFKNPKEKPAGMLVDQLGLKGLRVGGASVSTIHGNFIVNDGTATASDVLQLVSLLQEKVKAATGIDLHMEIEVIGEEGRELVR